MTDNSLSIIEQIKAEISSDLSKLAKSSFESADLPLNIVNMIKTTYLLASGIIESCEFIESNTGQSIHIDQIKEAVFCIQSVCDLTRGLIDLDDYGIVSSLIYNQEKLENNRE